MTTKFAKAKYTEYYDVGTQAGKLTILGIHTPTGAKPRQMLAGFFNQFRFFKYSGCSVKMHPAATLPADPLGVGYEAGELQMDPRENLNPIITKGCHGTSMNQVLDQIFGSTGVVDADGVSEKTVAMGGNNTEWSYYAALSDPTFKKWGIQSGLKLSCYPLVNPLVALHPILPNNIDNGSGQIGAGAGNSQFSAVNRPNGAVVEQQDGGTAVVDWNKNFMFTSGAKKLSWMPTRAFYPVGDGNTKPTLAQFPSNATVSYLPKIMMSVICLPPSYKIEQYFRVAITHYFSFKGFSTSLVGEKYDVTSAQISYVNRFAGDASKSMNALTYNDMVQAIPDEPTVEAMDGSVTLISSGVF